tara:strand:+ start:46 stop:456 length:411 start_codon:yes stop_codon:yes gene_type:complete
MATYKKTIKNYYFKKPKRLSENDYYSLKQVLRFNQNFRFYEVKPFWKEFEIGIYFSTAIFFGIPLSLLNETLSFIPGIGFVGAILYLIFNFESMLNYNNYINTKKKFFQDLQFALESTSNYEDYKEKEYRLHKSNS